MQANLLRHLIAWPALAVVVLYNGRSLADDNDPGAIEQRLKALESTPERQALVREPAANARKALKRLLDARAAGDAVHAVQLAALADDWAKLAANVVRAAEIEQQVATLQDQLTKTEQKRRRTETLLEATIAQRERTQQALLQQKAVPTEPVLPADAGATKPRQAGKAATKPPSPKATPTAVQPPATKDGSAARAPGSPSHSASTQPEEKR